VQHKSFPSKNSTLLVAGLCLFFGRYAVSFLLSSRKAKARLRQIRPVAHQHIQCPSGNTWYAELDGPQDAQPVVLIHGLQATRLQWYHQQKYLRQNYRLVLLDLPGHGRSGKPSSLSVQLMATDLQYVLLLLSINNPILYGHSLGGMILLRYCISNNNDQVKGVILHNCSYTNPLKTCLFSGFMQLIEKPLIIPYLQLVKRHSLAFNVLSRINFLSGLSIAFYRFLLFSGAQSARELRQLSYSAAICSAAVSADGILNTLKHETGPMLHRISTRCLVIGGENDRLIIPQTANYIASHVQNGQARIIPGGHLNLIEYADEVNAAIGGFIASTME
jgi:pimeloyl-ACP methyl ester carboxylesterase